MKLSSLWGRTRGKALKRIIAIGAVAIGLYIVWHSYRNGGVFDPDSYAKNQEVRDNQVIFPEEDEYSQEDGGQGDSDLWEKDHKAEEKLNPENMPESSVLFETEGKFTDFGSADQMVADTNQQGGIPGGPNGDGGPTILVPGEGGDIKVPDGTFGPDGNHSGSGNGSGGNGNEDDPRPPVDPDPILPDPDPKPELPPDLYEEFVPGGSETFPDGGISGGGSSVEITWMILDDPGETNPIYYGQTLDDWKLFCAVYAYVYVYDQDGFPTIYRIEGYSENFKIGSYPKVAREDFSVDFYFRANKDSEWQKETWNCKVKPFKVAFSGWEDGTYSSPAWYPQAGETKSLMDYYRDILPQEWMDIWLMPIELTEMFPGWSETPGGKPVPLIYSPLLPGRHVLYPLDLVPVPDGMSVSMELNWNYGGCIQTLNGYSGSGDLLKVPDGIASIDLYETKVDVVDIPSSVLEIYLGMDRLEVRQSYQVDEENPNYSSVDGMLLSKDKTTLYAVPLEKKVVTIPETVTYAEISDNAIEEIHFKSGTPAEMELGNLHDASIYVPSDAYFAYLAAWGDSLGTNRLLREDGTEAEFVIRDGAVLSGDGKILYKLLDSVSGIYTVPDGVEQIQEGAFAGHGVSMAILPESMKALDSQSMTGSQISRIICLGAEPPAIKKDSLDQLEGLKVQVPKGAGESFVDAWAPALGRETAEAIVVEAFNRLEDQKGFTYLEQEDGAILLKAPEDLAYFNGNELQAVTFKEIGSKAFSDCDSLLIAELPDSVKWIGDGAFENCDEIQGIISYSADTVAVGQNAFENCGKLRILAFNAARASFENGYSPDEGLIYWAPAGASGYEGGSMKADCDSYFLARQEKGGLLYGEDEEGRYVIAATDNISGNIVFWPNTLEIADEALFGCRESFTLDTAGMENLRYIGDYAFQYSGVTGDVILPDTLRYLGSYTFYGCTGIVRVHIDGLLDWYKNGIKGPQLRNGVFEECSNLEKVTFGSGCGLESIGEEAFWNTAISSIELPEGIHSILSGAFGNTRLTRIKMPSSLEIMYYSVFDGCTMLNEVEFSNEVPPALILFAKGPEYGYIFGLDLPEDFRIVLSGNAAGKEEEYIEAWKYAMIGYGEESKDELSEEQIKEGANIVRKLLGLTLAQSENASALQVTSIEDEGEEQDLRQGAMTEPPVEKEAGEASGEGTDDTGSRTDEGMEPGKERNEGEEKL